MTIRVLHIFQPNYKERFGGPIYDWKFVFNNWDNYKIEHFVLESNHNKILNAKEAFDFPISRSQKKIHRRQRFVWILQLLFSLIKNKKDYDILHFHILWWGSLLAGIWAKWNNIPAIYQSVLLNSDTPLGILKEKFGKLKLKIIKENFYILAISERLADEYLTHGYSQKQVFTLMNSVDTQLFHPLTFPDEKKILRQKYNLPLDSTVLVFVGSIKERKGVDILIQSFINTFSKFSNLHLLIIGPKNINENPSLDQRFIDELQKMVKKSRLENNITFTGLISDRNALAEIYRASDIFTFPSRNEGLPNVILEAMSSGLTILVSDLPGIRESITDGKNGSIAPIGDPIKFAQKLMRIIENPSKSSKMGVNASKYIQERHSFENWQSQISLIYSNLLSDIPKEMNF